MWAARTKTMFTFVCFFMLSLETVLSKEEMRTEPEGMTCNKEPQLDSNQEDSGIIRSVSNPQASRMHTDFLKLKHNYI